MTANTTGIGTGPGAQSDPPAGGQAPHPEGQAPNGQTQSETANPITDDRGRPITELGRALELLQQTRSEAADFRRQLRAVQQQQTQQQQAGQTEAQRLASELETTRAERDRLLGAARAGIVAQHAKQVAGELHAINPDVIARMVQLGDVEWDDVDPNKPKNIRRLVDTIRADFPDYFRSGNADGGTPGRPAKPDMNQLIRRASGRG